MENLSDDLLIEIWSRVPCKIAVRSKSISKRFLALISQPEFIQRSIHFHQTLLQHMKDEDLEKERHLNFISRRKILFLFLPKIHLLSPQNQLSLSFVGRKFDPKLDEVIKKKGVLYSRIMGCSNGLLLCKKAARGRVYFVCNPVTKNWTKLPLPPPPFTGHNERDRMSEGFVCESYYNSECSRVTLNRHRFRVVRIPLFKGTLSEFLRGVTKSEFEVVIFSSETGQWTTKLVSCPKGFTQGHVLEPAVAHGAKLYFMGMNSLMVYDPFNNDEECHAIDYPTHSYHDASYIPFRGHVGVCCGKIRISGISFIGPLNVGVWELEHDCSWRLVHMTSLPHQDYVPNSIIPELRAGAETHDVVFMGVRVRGFHPYHGDVVFFQYAHRIFVVNLKTKKFETVGYGIHGFDSLQIISLDLPWWPTPVPSIM